MSQDNNKRKHQKISECFRNTLNGMDAYERHKKFINDYVLHYKKEPETSSHKKYKTELQILKENHKFLPEEDDLDDSTWEKRIAKKYFDRLFKEYCLAELSLYKEGKIAMRWRTEKEVFQGKGQFECGSLSCTNRSDLQSWEVLFSYKEQKEKKTALVKLRLCPDCSEKLNYKKKSTKSVKSSKHTNQDDAPKDSSDNDDEDNLYEGMLE